MALPRLIYVADPMCSWCYGFSPAITELKEHFSSELPKGVELIMGGLRPGAAAQVLDEQLIKTLEHHWVQVNQRSGQAFDFEQLHAKAEKGFVYDTEPSCRAVVTVRHMKPGSELVYLAKLQEAFYRKGLDPTDTDILASLAQTVGVSTEDFRTYFDSEEAKTATRNDFVVAAKMGVRGFPTLIGVEGGQGQVLAPGWMRTEDVQANIRRWLATLSG